MNFLWKIFWKENLITRDPNFGRGVKNFWTLKAPSQNKERGKQFERE